MDVLPPHPATQRQIRDAAEVAVVLIEQLANRRILVDAEDQKRIVSALSDELIGSPDSLPTFWQSYVNVVSKFPAEEDPLSVYYAASYTKLASLRQIGKETLQRIPPQTIRIVRSIRRFYIVTTFISLGFLLALIFCLAYASAITNLSSNTGKLLDEYVNFINGRFDLTRYAGVISNCPAGDIECIEKYESYKISIDKSLVGTLGQLQKLLWPFFEKTKDPTFLEAAEVREHTSTIIGFINGYLVPLLAGILGASLAILREVYIGFKSSQVSLRAFRIAYVRMALGAISGIAVGWFGVWVSGERETVPFTPLVVAFAAGYAVEVIFSLLDRAASILTGKGDPVANRKPA
jgi:hypothetical protein